jgi:hypothetical protein
MNILSESCVLTMLLSSADQPFEIHTLSKLHSLLKGERNPHKQG